MEKEVEKKIAKFFSQFKTSRYKRSETLIRPGDIPTGVYFIKKGYMRLYSISDEGKELTLIIYPPGDFLPIVWTLKNVPGIYYVECLTSCELAKSSKEEFVSFIKSDPDVWNEITVGIITRFQTALKRMEYLTFGNAYQKVASILVILAQAYGEPRGSGAFLQIPLTHKDIADLAGRARETTSVELEKLRKKGLIKSEGRHFVIPDLIALKRESLLGEEE